MEKLGKYYSFIEHSNTIGGKYGFKCQLWNNNLCTSPRI